MNRKNFLQKAVIGTSGILAFPNLMPAQNGQATLAKPKGDPLPAEKVKEFVIAGHSDLEKVKSMLVEMPALLYATWDWGGGDFETALEGAGHMGNKPIANYLIGIGARTNLFVLAMLGKTEIVKSYLEIFPAWLGARGPHGFTLLHHAQKGGDDGKDLLEWLQAKGLKESQSKL